MLIDAFADTIQQAADRVDKKFQEAFKNGVEHGIEEGVRRGMTQAFHATSELTDEENELLIAFLVRHNFVICYDPLLGGLRLRGNDKMNPQMEKVVCVIDDSTQEVMTTHIESIAKNELMKLKFPEQR